MLSTQLTQDDQNIKTKEIIQHADINHQSQCLQGFDLQLTMIIRFSYISQNTAVLTRTMATRRFDCSICLQIL